jgi:hypothetical protein
LVEDFDEIAKKRPKLPKNYFVNFCLLLKNIFIFQHFSEVDPPLESLSDGLSENT